MSVAQFLNLSTLRFIVGMHFIWSIFWRLARETLSIRWIAICNSSKQNKNNQQNFYIYFNSSRILILAIFFNFRGILYYLKTDLYEQFLRKIFYPYIITIWDLSKFYCGSKTRNSNQDGRWFTFSVLE